MVLCPKAACRRALKGSRAVQLDWQLPADCGLAVERLCAHLMAACHSAPVSQCKTCVDCLMRPLAASVHAVAPQPRPPAPSWPCTPRDFEKTLGVCQGTGPAPPKVLHNLMALYAGHQPSRESPYDHVLYVTLKAPIPEQQCATAEPPS